ncbi:MAG: outer membrane protein assembly factor BamB family protein, partial [Candidatus Hodarchaeales archaeon]
PSRITSFGTRCIDLYTGEDVWYLDGINIAFAQTLNVDNPNEHGVIPFLWSTRGSTWDMYDPWTGNHILTIENVTTGWTTFGSNGEILNYNLNAATDTLTLWNSTKAIQPVVVGFNWFNPNLGSVLDGRKGIEWTVNIPDVPGSPSIKDMGEGYILANVWDTSVHPQIWRQVAYDVDAITKDANGNYPTSINHLWLKDREIFNTLVKPRQISEGVYAQFSADELQFHGYDIKTGNELWVTDPLPSGWDYFTYTWLMAYGNLYATGYGGKFYAWDGKTGDLLWEYDMGNSGVETPTGTYPVYNGFTVADGKIFFCNDEHSADAVLFRGGKLHVIDAFTGEPVWNIAGWLKNPAISDGIATSINAMDLQIYTFGKGTTATTVTAPKTEIMQGQKIVIEGTITDQSPGQPGTPAISDEDMAAWMEYLHMQKSLPSNAKGVELSLDVIDANGNFRNIGTAVSDIAGKFSLVWEPDIPGQYTVIATFAGSESYGSSFDQTTFYVEEVPQPTPSPEPTPAPQTETYILGSTIAILAGLIIAIFLLLKRK